MLVEELSDVYNLPLSTEYSKQSGWMIKISAADLPRQVPDVFLQITRSGKKITMSTEDLRRMNQRVAESATQIHHLAAQVHIAPAIYIAFLLMPMSARFLLNGGLTCLQMSTM